ncbi:MAG: methyltransferase domain-containing protein [bacterium]|nr:MAG: methyltransferase domain-containing protein [bacterium]
MQGYLNQKIDVNDPVLISVIDELPLWSAPFGLKLLETIRLKKGMNVLDIGCGLGFPLIELAARLGNSCKVYGIDPWERALERVRLKMKVYDIKNVAVVHGYAENMPFENGFFDLIVSNNGINNVNDMNQTLNECYRVCKLDAQMTITLNLEKTMIEFYDVFRETLAENCMYDEVKKMKEHIYSKRKPLDEIKSRLVDKGFSIKKIFHDSFKLRFVDGTTMLNHYLIRYWFMDGWKKVLLPKNITTIFERIESKLNQVAELKGEIVLTIPYVTIDCRK